MEKHIVLRENSCGATFTHYGRAVSCYEFFAAHDYSIQQEAIRFFEVKGKNKAKRAESFIEKALSDGLTIETFNRYGERVHVVALE